MQKEINGQSIPFVLLDETASTNSWIKEASRSGAIEPPFLCVAKKQTAGRGNK